MHVSLQISFNELGFLCFRRIFIHYVSLACTVPQVSFESCRWHTGSWEAENLPTGRAVSGCGAVMSTVNKESGTESETSPAFGPAT